MYTPLMTTAAIILGKQVKNVLLGGAVVLAIALGTRDVDGVVPVLVFVEGRWTTAAVPPSAFMGLAAARTKEMRAAREAAANLL